LKEAGVLKSSTETELDRTLKGLGDRLISGPDPKISGELQLLLRDHPEDLRVWLMLSMSRLLDQNWAGSLEAIDRCLAIEPQLRGGRIIRAMVLAGQWRRDESLVELDRAVDSSSSDKESFLHRGRFLVLYYSENPDQLRRGLADLQRALDLGAPGALVHGLLGSAYRRLGDDARAVHHLEEARRLNPRQMDVLRELVTLQCDKGELKNARSIVSQIERTVVGLSREEAGGFAFIQAILAQAERAAPETIEACYRQASSARPTDTRITFQFVAWLEDQNRREEAVALLRGALGAAPDPDLSAQLAWALADSGASLQEAKKWLEVAKRKYGSDPYLSDTEAWIAFRAGNHREAWGAIQRSLTLVETVPEVAYHAGAIQAALGHRERAIEYLTTSLKSAKAFQGHQEARSLLRSLNSVR
jgi:tetratricopeptide (TPR) repeat protein